MRLPPKDDPHGNLEGRLPLSDVLEVLRRHGVTIDPDEPNPDDFVTLVSDEVVEVQQLPDPVGGLMVRYLARKFDIDTVEFYFFRQIDEQNRRPPVH